MEASYLSPFKSGELEQKANYLNDILQNCTLCPHKCLINRTKDEMGQCNTEALPMVSSYAPHWGEEPPLVGTGGSGTVFFTNCNLSCQFCQNYDISQLGRGMITPIAQLAKIFLFMQKCGCHNLNLVTPTHVIPAVIKALLLAIPKGFNLPLVYNTGGYDLLETIEVLDGIIDIYLPDMKYADNKIAQKYSNIPNYEHYNKKALKEMYRQVGILKCDKNGVAQKGLIIRHLVLPFNLAGSENIIKFVAEELSPQVHFNLMKQYHPAYKAYHEDKLNRRVSDYEYDQAVDLVKAYGLTNCWID